jgi:nucleotide-binding universal stress UspA family protein
MNETILVPLDGSKTGEAALPYVDDLVSKLAPGVKAEVVLLQVLSQMTPDTTTAGLAELAIRHTTEQMEENKKQAMDYLNQTGEALTSKGATVTARVEVGEASEEIIKVAEEINANLIAMSTHGRSGLTRWAFGSVTDRVLRREAKIPITMLRAPK